MEISECPLRWLVEFVKKVLPTSKTEKILVASLDSRSANESIRFEISASNYEGFGGYRSGQTMLTLATKFLPNRVAFETASRTGFQAAEFWLDASLLEQNGSIAALASQFPFRYALHFPNHGPIPESALHASASLYRSLKCTAMVIHQPMYDRYGAALRAIAPDLDLGIENHVLDKPGFDRWAEQSPGLTLDVEHLWKFTLKNAPLPGLLDHIERFLQCHAGKLQHVHLPGYLPGGEEHHPIYHSPEMASEVLTRLADHGFKKLVVSEADAPFQTDEFLSKDVLFFKNWLNARGKQHATSSAESSLRSDTGTKG